MHSIETQEISKAIKVQTLHDDSKIADTNDIDPTKQEYPVEFYLDFLNEAFAAGQFINLEKTLFVKQSLTMKANLITLNQVFDPDLYSQLLISTPNSDILTESLHIFISLIHIEPAKYLQSSINLFNYGMENSILVFANCGVAAFHIIIEKFQSIPDELKFDNFIPSVQAILNSEKPFALINILILIKDLLMYGYDCNIINFNRIIDLCRVDHQKVQLNALKLLNVLIIKLPNIQSPSSILEILANIVMNSSFNCSVAALECFSALMPLSVSTALNILTDRLFNYLVTVVTTNSKGIIVGYSLMLKISIFHCVEEFRERIEELFSLPELEENLLDTVENGSSIQASHAQQILDFMERIGI